ncbi:hypothetical protein D3C76_1851910 [compost metagenome]
MTIMLQVQTRNNDVMDRMQRLLTGLVNQHEFRAAILQHMAQAILRVVRIDWHIGGPRF